MVDFGFVFQRHVVVRRELVISSIKLTVCCMDSVSDGLLSFMVTFQRAFSEDLTSR